MAGSRARCGRSETGLGAGHGARGPARQDRERNLARRRSDDRQQYRRADALGAARSHRDLAVFRAGQGGRQADARAHRSRGAHQHPHQFAGVHRFAAGAQRLRALSRGAAQARRRALRGAAEARPEAAALSPVSQAPTRACTPRRWSSTRRPSSSARSTWMRVGAHSTANSVS